MKQETGKHLPKRRSEGIIVRGLPEEVLVYDRDRDKAHCLNRSAAAIWEHCDGHSTAAEIARSVEKQTGMTLSEELVWLAIEALGRDHLLAERVEWPAAIPHMTRREAVRRIGIGAIMAVPIVTTIIAPTPAQASTCLARCSSCSTGAQCCSGVCASGVSGCASGMRCT
jgi:Coenzyme PQQ synthesis protein D (PqqD)